MTASDLSRRTLLIPARADPERDAVARAWREHGGAVLPLDRFWEPPRVPAPALYGPDTFALVVAEVLGLTLVSPDDALLLRAPGELLGRRVEGISLDEALGGPFPSFVKPLAVKQFRAGVWRDREALADETRGLGGDTPVLRSEVVRFTAEARAFVREGRVLTAAVYEGDARADDARSLFDAALEALTLPAACVLDAGRLDDGRWVLLEANAAWGAGLNGCDARLALPAIAAATSA